MRTFVPPSGASITGTAQFSIGLSLRVVGVVALLLLALVFLPERAVGQEVVDWSGAWDTRWRGGGARIELEQDGNRVTGRYRLFNGRIEATATGRQLVGRWIETGREGEFVFVQSRDGDSFMGRFEAASGEWWTGTRVEAALEEDIELDQSSPMAALRSFLGTMNESGADDLERVASGTADLVGKAATLIDLSQSERGDVNRIDYTRLLFSVLDMLTIRLWDLPHEDIRGDRVAVTLNQAGTAVAFNLTFRRSGNRWFIVGPPLADLETKLEELAAARGISPDAVSDPREFRTPRDTFKILLWGLNTFGNAANNPAYRTLDMRELAVAVRSHEAPLLTGYIKQVLDRIGYVYWQEIPDDPDSQTPYVHFEHPAGDITVAPVETDDGVIWQFTPDTLRNIRTLYAAIDEMPAAPAFESTASEDLYFRTRGVVRQSAPRLLAPLGPMERWQWFALGLVSLLGIVFGFLASAAVFAIARRTRDTRSGPLTPPVVRLLAWSTRAIFFGLFLVASLGVLGLPQLVAAPVQATAWVAIIFGAIPVAWHLIGQIADGYRRRWITPGYHETLLSLSSGVARIAILIAAVLLLAEALALPYQGVIAGLGIGGLAVALAAQPTMQNFLSGLTLYADRPISVGDFCRFGDQLGTVEHIGMRSTRVRSLDRTVISIPNSEFANMQLENYAWRDRIRLVTTVQLRYETTPDQLRYVLSELRRLLIAHPRVAKDPCSVRFVGFGEYSLDVEVFTYILTSDYSEFLAIREDIYLRMMNMVEEAGAQFAFPSSVEYQAPDTLHDPDKRASAEQKVQAWREQEKLPFPDFDSRDTAEFRDSLTYPPEGSPQAPTHRKEPPFNPSRPSDHHP